MDFLLGIDLPSFIEAAGYVGIFAIVFAESGLFIGFFLPGDSLVFTAGFLASQGFLNIGILAALCFLGAVLGDSFGYLFGQRVGPGIFNKKDSLLFKKEYLAEAWLFYEKYGGKTIVLARFIPIVRTFAPILAGVGEMHYLTFLLYNVIGGALWAMGLTALGYYLGHFIPNVDQYLLPIIFLIIFISISPGLFHLIKNKKYRKGIITAISRLFKNGGGPR